MSLHIGTVIERAVHFEAVITLSAEIVDVLQYDPFASGHNSHIAKPRGSKGWLTKYPDFTH